MTLHRHQSCAMIVDTQSASDTWCVFEHQAVLNAGDPPVAVFVDACRLVDVFRLGTARTNSEWVRMFGEGGQVMVNIVATTTEKAEAYRAAREHMARLDPPPYCNMQGRNIRSMRRALRCLENDRVYRTQTEAARDLNIAQSAICRHLAGEAKTAQGFTFVYDSAA